MHHTYTEKTLSDQQGMLLIMKYKQYSKGAKLRTFVQVILTVTEQQPRQGSASENR